MKGAGRGVMEEGGRKGNDIGGRRRRSSFAGAHRL